MTPLGSGAYVGALPSAIVVTAGFGHRDSDGRFQPSSRPGLPIPGSSFPTPLVLGLGKRTPRAEFQPQVSVERGREGAPCPSVTGKHCVSGSTTKAYDLT